MAESPDTSRHRQLKREAVRETHTIRPREAEEELRNRLHGNHVHTVKAMTGGEDKLSPRQGRAQLGGRVLRNRRYRRPFDDNRQTKRLFTPEIKKFLKDWLVRRRDHPYPNRDEKKRLAMQTGLTYIQICNWFANWRRKLKNAGQEKRSTWGNLIKNYNTQAQGNVEQFSICSDDSIWEQQALTDAAEGDKEHDAPRLTFAANATAMDHSYSVVQNKTVESGTKDDGQPQCFQVTSTTTEEEDAHTARHAVSMSTGIATEMAPPNGASGPTLEEEEGDPVPRTTGACGPTSTSKYKSHIMEKYLRDLRLEPSQSDEAENAHHERAHLCDRENQNTASNRGKESVLHSSTTAINEVVPCHNETNTRFEKKSKTIKKAKDSCPPLVLSKWLESAAKFQPTKCYVPWSVSKSDAWRASRSRNNSKKTQKPNVTVDAESVPPKTEIGHWGSKGHHREELDAAEALTRLSGLQQ